MTDNAVANKYYGPGVTKATKPTKEDISKISQEYALNTLLKAEIMRNKPQVAAYYEKPLRSSLSPHYKRAAQLKKTMNSFNDYPVTRAALMNAKIELN